MFKALFQSFEECLRHMKTQTDLEELLELEEE